MKRGILYTGIICIILGIIGRIFANQYSYVSADGMLHDSALMPISALLLLFGVLFVIIFGILFLIRALRNRKLK